MPIDIEHTGEPPEEEAVQPPKPKRSAFRIVLNSVIVVLLAAVGFFSYTYLSRSTAQPEQPKEQAVIKTPRGIQLDVLNGCGVKGTAAKFTNYLRSSGFDVVESKNYKTSHIPHTMVIDRVGDLATARRVAASLGVADQYVIQQLSADYFVAVSVIIGDDYSKLRPAQ